MKADKLQRSDYVFAGLISATILGIVISALMGILAVAPGMLQGQRLVWAGFICGIGTVPISLLGMMNNVVTGMLLLSFEYKSKMVFGLINIGAAIAFGIACGLAFPLIRYDPNNPLSDIELFPLRQVVSFSVIVCLANSFMMTCWLLSRQGIEARDGEES